MAQSQVRPWRWSLRTLLLVVAPVCVAAAYGAGVYLRISRAIEARQLMASKGIVSPQGALVDGVFRFRPGAVADDDLAAFVPAFNGSLPDGLEPITALDLNGSPVSEAAIKRFEAAVPDCEVRR
jgi:hypothetical protein